MLIEYNARLAGYRVPRELGLGRKFKINTGQKCFVTEDFVFIKKRKKHWNIGTETTDGIPENKKFPNKAILSDNVAEASRFVLDDNTSTRLADGRLPEAEYPMAKKHLNYAVFKAMMPGWPIIEMKGL
jgi:hypothetical protein